MNELFADRINIVARATGNSIESTSRAMKDAARAMSRLGLPVERSEKKAKRFGKEILGDEHDRLKAKFYREYKGIILTWIAWQIAWLALKPLVEMAIESLLAWWLQEHFNYAAQHGLEDTLREFGNS